MNGVHDMGGMHNMGPIPYEENEPIFHEQWEARMFALTRPMGAWRKWNLHATRHQREQIPPAEYMRMSYYEIWLTALIEQMVKSGLVTCAEIERVTPAPGSPKLTPALTPDKVLPLIARGAPDSRNIPAIARFQTGQSVRVDNLNPAGHIRLPRYARGKIGTVERVTASSSFRTTTPFSSARSPSIYIRCAFPRANYLATKPRRKMGFIYRSVG